MIKQIYSRKNIVINSILRFYSYNENELKLYNAMARAYYEINKGRTITLDELDGGKANSVSNKIRGITFNLY